MDWSHIKDTLARGSYPFTGIPIDILILGRIRQQVITQSNQVDIKKKFWPSGQ